MPVALLALTLGGFGIGLTEFVIAGLLPEVADTFDVSEARAGALVSGYALSVAIGAVLVTAAVTRLDGSASTSCRPRSPPYTTRRPPPRTPTGRRSSRRTRCSNGCRTARWWC